jgi:hypothetical protein
MRNIAYIFLAALVPIIGYGQTEKVLVPSDLKQLTVVTEPSTLYKGFFRAGIDMSYGVVDKYFDTKGKRVFIPSNGWGKSSSLSPSLQYGITNRLQAIVTIPYVSDLQQGQYILYAPSADTTVNGSILVKGKGIGDLNTAFKYQIIPEGAGKYSLTARVYLTIPTGEKNPTDIKGPYNFKSPTGNGCFSTELNLTYRKIIYPYSYTGYIGYNYSFSGSKFLDSSDTKETEFNYGDIFNAGASFNFHLNEWIAMTNDLNFTHWGKTEIDNEIPDNALSKWVIGYETHLVFQIKRFRVAEAVLIRLAGKNETPADPQYVMIVQYTF